MYCDVDLVLIRGIGGSGTTLERLVREAAEVLRDQGIIVCFSKLTVPAGDDELEPVLLVNGRELYVPPLDIASEVLVNLIVYELFRTSVASSATIKMDLAGVA